MKFDKIEYLANNKFKLQQGSFVFEILDKQDGLVINYNGFDLFVFNAYIDYDCFKLHRKVCSFKEAIKLAKLFVENFELIEVFG